MTAAERIAAFAVGLDAAAIPDDVLTDAKHHLLDTLGCGLAASASGNGTSARSVFSATGGTQEATVIGAAERLPAPSAAFANGVLCHALDFDDTHADSVAHVSVTAGPVAMAEAEAAGASGRELLAAYLVSVETTARLGMAASGAFHARGLHPTSVCGVFGATAAAARLRGLDERTTARALGLAGSMSSGLLAYLDDGTETKPIHAGFASHAGIVAARLAQEGAEGPPSVFEGRFGIFRALLGTDVDIAAQVADLGERWEMSRTAYKPYPSCHIMHGVLGSARALLPEIPPERVAQIEEIVAVVPASAPPVILEPVDAKLAPRSDYEGKFSTQYSTAWMLVHRSVTLQTYVDESLRDEQVLALAQRVRYETAPFPTESRAFPGAIRIRFADGAVLEASLDHQLGAPENPLTPADVVEKFRANAALALDRDTSAALEAAILSLDAAPSAREALSDLRPKG